MSEKSVAEEEIRDTEMKTEEDTACEDSVADTEKETETAETETPKQSPLQEFLDWAVPYVVVCVIAVAFFLCFRIVNVSGSSMNNTYQEGDTVIVNAAFYQGSDRGDIVVVNATDEVVPLIKRVIAVGGDEIDIDFESGNVTLNGTILEEPYIKEPTTTDYGGFTYPVTVPDGYYFVMGDNRNNSIDSRHSSIGFVAEEDIMGNVMFKLPF